MAIIQRSQRKVQDKLTTGVPTMPSVSVDNSKAIIAEAAGNLLGNLVPVLAKIQDTKNLVESENLYTKFLSDLAKIDTILKQQYNSDPESYETARNEALSGLKDTMLSGIKNAEVKDAFETNANRAIEKSSVGAFEWAVRQRSILNTENMANTFEAKGDLISSSDNVKDFYDHLVETKQYYDVLKSSDNTIDKQDIDTAYNRSRKNGVDNYFYRIADSDEPTIKETVMELDHGMYDSILDEKEKYQKTKFLNEQLEQLKQKREYETSISVSYQLRNLLDLMHNEPDKLTSELLNKTVENLTLNKQYKGPNVKIISILDSFIKNRDKVVPIRFPKQTNQEAYSDLWNTYQIITRNIKGGTYDPEDVSYFLSKVEENQKKNNLSKSDYDAFKASGFEYLIDTTDRIYGIQRDKNRVVIDTKNTPYTQYLATGIENSEIRGGTVSNTVLDFMQDIDSIVDKFYPSLDQNRATQKKGAILADYLKETAKYKTLSTQMALNQSELVNLNPERFKVENIVFNNVLKNANITKEQALNTIFVDKNGKKFKFIADKDGNIVDYQGI